MNILNRNCGVTESTVSQMTKAHLPKNTAKSGTINKFHRHKSINYYIVYFELLRL